MSKVIPSSKPKHKTVKELGKIDHYQFDRRIPQILATASDSLLNTEGLSKWMGVSEMCVKIWRLRISGPPYSKPSPHTINYSRQVVEIWLKQRQAAIEKETWVNSFAGEKK